MRVISKYKECAWYCDSSVLRSCLRVVLHVLGFLSIIVCMVFVTVKQHLKKKSVTPQQNFIWREQVLRWFLHVCCVVFCCFHLLFLSGIFPWEIWCTVHREVVLPSLLISVTDEVWTEFPFRKVISYCCKLMFNTKLTTKVFQDETQFFKLYYFLISLSATHIILCLKRTLRNWSWKNQEGRKWKNKTFGSR